MKATEYARSQIEGALDFLATCAKDMDEAQYNHKPDGKCNPAGKLHAHALSGADFFVTGVLQGQTAKWPEFASQTGLPENAREIWGSDATINSSVMEAYASAIKDPILAYIDTLTDEQRRYLSSWDLEGVAEAGAAPAARRRRTVGRMFALSRKAAGCAAPARWWAP